MSFNTIDMGNRYSINNSNIQSNLVNNPPEKTPEQLELEEKQREEYNEKARKKYKDEAASAINIYKYAVLQRVLNKNFKVKFPIESINNIPVNMYFVFTESNLTGNRNYWEMRSEPYNIDLCIYAKWDENKILYKEQLTWYNRPDLIDFNVIDDYYRSDTILVLKIHVSKTEHTIDRLYNDSYMECFSKQPPVDYSTLFNGVKHNSGIKFEKVYICNSCNGQTKNKDLCCFFCQNMEQ